MFATILKGKKAKRVDGTAFVDDDGNRSNIELHNQMVEGVDEAANLKAVRRIASKILPKESVDKYYPEKS